MTANVIQFTPRPATSKPAGPTKQASQAQTELTQWDKDFERYGAIPEYSLCATLLAMSWAYQTGRISLGDKFLAACRKHGWAHQIPLDRELGNALLEADFSISVGGPKDQRHG